MKWRQAFKVLSSPPLSIHETVTASDVLSRSHLKVPCLDVGWRREAHREHEGSLRRHTSITHFKNIQPGDQSQLQYFILLC